jgi:glutaredoxin-related protein
MTRLNGLPVLGIQALLFMPDFSALLSKPTSEIKKPKPMPEGTYMGLVLKQEYREADTPKDKENPKKPVCQYSVRLTEALDDVDQADLADALQGEDITAKRPMDYDFWLTPDAQYRVVEFAQSCGVPTEGRTLGEIIPECVNQTVRVSVVKVQSKKPGQEDTWFANISNMVGVNGATE